MAKAHTCDRCDDVIKNEGNVFLIKFTTIDTPNHTKTEYELCRECLLKVLKLIDPNTKEEKLEQKANTIGHKLNV